MASPWARKARSSGSLRGQGFHQVSNARRNPLPGAHRRRGVLDGRLSSCWVLSGLRSRHTRRNVQPSLRSSLTSAATYLPACSHGSVWAKPPKQAISSPRFRPASIALTVVIPPRLPGLVTAAQRSEWIRGALSRRSASQAWWYMLVPVEMPVVCTWALGTLAATAGIAEPTKADPAKPSARMAGIMKARPMRMTPPCQTPRPGPGVAPVADACAPAGVITAVYAGESYYRLLIVAKQFTCYLRIRCHPICREDM
jgi:hypothetical protein